MNENEIQIIIQLNGIAIMAFKYRAYNVEDGNEVMNDIDGPAFYKKMLFDAASRLNRKTSKPTSRIRYWNLDLVGNADNYGKIWLGSLNLTKSQNIYLSLANFASEQMYNFYYQFEDSITPNVSLKDENNNDIFQNLVRFTLSDFYYALKDSNENPILEISPPAQPIKLSGYLPYNYKLDGDGISQYLHQVNVQKTPLFIDIDHPEGYFVMENGKWVKKDLPEAELKNTEILYWIDNAGNIHCGKLHVPERRSRSAGGGGGAMRADSVTEVDYLWSGNKSLGIALGLHKNLFTENDTPPVDYFETTPLISGTNRPKPLVRYFKKFKNLAQPNDKRNEPRPPKIPIPPKVFHFNNTKELRTSKYFYSTDFFKLRQKGKKEEPTGWLGLGLQHSNTRDRDDAGPVMGQALNDFVNFKQSYDIWRMPQNPQPPKSSSTVSADNFTDFMLSKINIQNEWSALKKLIYEGYGIDTNKLAPPFNTDWDKRRTNQEWCHLFGHGDGGVEEWGNFVAGSKHCNTVQLAIETGQRKGKISGLKVKVSAYLFEHFELKEAATFDDLKNFINNQGKYDQVAKFLENSDVMTDDREQDTLPTDFGKIIIDKVGEDVLTKQQKIQLLNRFCVAYPLAKMIHYKVYKGDVNVFEYFFDAQSESFDYNEFKILEDIVVRAIARTDKEMQEAYNEVMLKKLFDQVNKGNITADDYNDINNANYFPVTDEEEGDIDSSDDESAPNAFSPTLTKKRSSFSDMQQDTQLNSKKAKTVIQPDTDYTFQLVPPN